MNGLKILAFSTIALVISGASTEAAEPGKNGFTMAFSAHRPAALAATPEDLNFDPIIGLTPFVGVGDDADSAAFGARIALTQEASLSFGYSLAIEPHGGLTPNHSLILGFDYGF